MSCGPWRSPSLTSTTRGAYLPSTRFASIPTRRSGPESRSDLKPWTTTLAVETLVDLSRPEPAGSRLGHVRPGHADRPRRRAGPRCAPRQARRPRRGHPCRSAPRPGRMRRRARHPAAPGRARRPKGLPRPRRHRRRSAPGVRRARLHEVLPVCGGAPAKLGGRPAGRPAARRPAGSHRGLPTARRRARAHLPRNPARTLATAVKVVSRRRPQHHVRPRVPGGLESSSQALKSAREPIEQGQGLAGDAQPSSSTPK